MPTQRLQKRNVPSYRQRSGYSQAIVTLRDSQTGQVRDYWLGEFDSPESHERYHRVIAEWESRGRRLPPRDFDAPPSSSRADAITIVEVVRDYWLWAKQYYRPKHVQALDGAVKLLRRYFGRTPAIDFGPKSLRLLRDHMVRGGEDRKPWSRKYINAQVRRIRHMFKWAAGQELVPVSVHQSLATVEPLRKGRTEARETAKVGPAPHHLVDAVLPNLTRPVKAIVQLQLLSGARPGELLNLRPCDIHMDDSVGIWTYQPEKHKNAYREHDRTIYFGPRAQVILKEFLRDRPTSAFLFSPAESDAERRAALAAMRKTPLSCGNRAGTNKRDEPLRKPGECFTTNGYHRAVQYACDRTFPPPTALARKKGESPAQWEKRLRASGRWDELMAWRHAHRFHPNQLRHSAATNLRREAGLEAAQLALGHSSAQVTDAVYAERDHAKVVELMKRIG